MPTTPYQQWRPHPWHGLSAGPQPPERLHAYIEITPFDPVKYEIDKESGYLRVDRPQRSSSYPPTLYGFIPRTYCGPRVGRLSKETDFGDGDPLDVCVVSERPISHADVLLTVCIVGGIRTLDAGKADDKIIAVLENDTFWGQVEDVAELPSALIERLRHYFSTYKLIPGQPPLVTIRETYGRAVALQVVQAALDDYAEAYGGAQADPH